ncbi:ATP-binding cassette domain-containing protein [Lacrimispora defluvii]|uniref:ABC transporter ATP-binding protein n=1 Tax=Lacrimispora defluvii TaxID=2719233 RepID=A0ABX1W0A5_9FIRM|nr:ABC transporter ATP-binding protein [Lacrimispora defluvii]NNJ32146.1 ABC transporter ATP-binding protein [Lacrimispora defluvii]
MFKTIKKLKQNYNFIRILVATYKVLSKSSKKYFVLTIFLSILTSIPDVLSLYIWKSIVDEITHLIGNGEIGYRKLCLLFSLHMILTLANLIIGKYTNYIKRIYVIIVDRYITDEVLMVISSLDLQDLEDSNLHNDIQKTSNESTNRSIKILDNLVSLIKNLAMLLGTIGILISLKPEIVIILIISVIPSAVINRRSMDKLYEVYDGRYEEIRYNRNLKDTISKYENFKELKLFSSFLYLKNKMDAIFDKIIKQDIEVKREILIKSSVGDFIQLSLTYLFKILITVFGVLNKCSLGCIVISIESASRLQNALMNSIEIVLSLYENCLYLLSFEKLQKLKNDKNEEKRISKITDFVINTIELVHVSFRYKSSLRNYALKDINLKFEKGGNYAIVGYNGSGKTSLIKLISGLYVPTEGQILINGINLKYYDKDIYYEKISATFQDFVKFPLTVRENIGISMYKQIENMNLILHAANMGKSYEFISRLMNQFETKLLISWKNSEELSSGQWQRIAISRGVMRKPQLMIFDEPTSSLDAESESEIFQNLMQQNGDRITLLITHRFVNVRDLDAIIVLNQGRVDGVGKHDYLINTNKLYAALYQIQSNYYSDRIN